MPYIKTTWIAGNTIEVAKTYSARYGKKIARGANINKTPAAVKRYNAQMAERELRLLINENFGYQDYHVTLTYRKEERPDPETAKKQLSRFLGKLRRAYRKAGKELRWISVTEYKRTAIHHHVILNRHDIGLIADAWPYGRPKIVQLDNTGDYAALAAYLIKETSKTFGEPDSPNKKRWSASRNLRKPKVKKQVIPAEHWAADPKPVKGYQLIRNSVYMDVSPVTGFPYQWYRMVRPTDRRKQDESL